MITFKWKTELQQDFDKSKEELTDCTLLLAIPTEEKPFYVLCDALNYGIGTRLLHKKQLGKIDIRNPTFYPLRDCSAIIFALS